MSKFTPGPWRMLLKPQGRIGPIDNIGFIVFADDPEDPDLPWRIAETIEGIDDYPDEANARLIAGAPEMYELLENLANPLLQIAGPEALEHYATEARELLRRIDGEGD